MEAYSKVALATMEQGMYIIRNNFEIADS